ncbi:Bcr/CflA family efflux MFS transporter [Mycetocola tolaasinivorans]|uniref:Bcr/CflA family efflux MFS transporter n=1 Tax=Mycetocola tolaasinivorans TaxID=76635 RepID=A0A3L7A1J0_9MICO|nr:multidrug effflux MFS transporter [Mycetocola tolaasinivorans]RLP74089.1 Bcr/CflA family efflux MFS transporter [Mycetocola tolaasinivorans]
MTTVVHPGDALSRRQRLAYVFILGALTALGPFTIDLYLPAFPRLQADFDVSVTAIQLTLTGTTVGFAIGQLFMGPWSDKVGRRTPLMIATAVHVLASLGCMLAPDLMVLGIFRVLQGAGAAAGAVVATATVRDLFGGRPLVVMLSRLALVNGMAPILAPMLGGMFLSFMDWRGLFVVLAIYGIAVMVAVSLWIVETLPPERRRSAGFKATLAGYRSVLSDRIYVGAILIGALSFSGLFAYLSASSFLFQDFFGLSATEYGFLFAGNSVGIVAGVQISSRLMRRIAPQWVLAGSTIVQLIAAVAIIALASSGAGLFGILVPLFVFIMACGFGFPATQVTALARHGDAAGIAASLMGAVNFGLAGILSPAVGILGGDGPAMGMVMAGTSVAAIIVLWAVVRPRTVPALTD